MKVRCGTTIFYVMCDKIRQAEMECYEEEVEKRDKYEDDG